MGIFKFPNFFRVKEEAAKTEEDFITLWEDDYLQVEILPTENLAFLKEQLKLAYEFGEAHRTPEGFFTDMYVRKGNPAPTIGQEFRADTLENLLIGDGLPKYRRIEYNHGREFYTVNNKTHAFRFNSFTLFYETEGEFVKNIWATVKAIPSSAQLDVLVSALYNLGEGYDLLLIDWNTDELVDLKNQNHIRAYLA